MSKQEIDESIRHQLIQLAKRKSARITSFSRKTPNNWNPTQIINPLTDMPFTPEGAWIYIIERLEEGHKVTEVDMKKPGEASLIGYVMLVDITPNKKLYIKLQIGKNGTIIGRSFHYSYDEKGYRDE